MNRSELISRLAQRFPSLHHRDAQLSVQVILETVAAHLAQDNRIEIRGFGSFKLNTRPPRLGRNPKTGEKVVVPKKKVPHFKAGVELRERVNRG